MADFCHKYTQIQIQQEKQRHTKKKTKWIISGEAQEVDQRSFNELIFSKTKEILRKTLWQSFFNNVEAHQPVNSSFTKVYCGFEGYMLVEMALTLTERDVLEKKQKTFHSL